MTGKSTAERWAEERRAAEKEIRRRKRLGIAAHDSEGRIELHTATIEDPHVLTSTPGETDEEVERRRFIAVQRNVLHDVLEYEFAHKRINLAQKTAGDRFLADFERAGIGGAQAIDYSQAKV